MSPGAEVGGTTYYGPVLHLPLPNSRAFSRDEARAMIAHELAHLAHRDLENTLGWIEVRLLHTWEILRALGAICPPLPTVTYLSDCLCTVHGRLRRREKEAADRRVVSGLPDLRAAFTSGLLKSVPLDLAWLQCVERAPEAGNWPLLLASQQTPLLPSVPEILAMDAETGGRTHRHDSHPPLVDRVAAAGTPLDSIRCEIPSEPPGWIDDAETWERRFTTDLRAQSPDLRVFVPDRTVT